MARPHTRPVPGIARGMVSNKRAERSIVSSKIPTPASSTNSGRCSRGSG